MWNLVLESIFLRGGLFNNLFAGGKVPLDL